MLGSLGQNVQKSPMDPTLINNDDSIPALFIPFVINIWYTTTTKWESRNCTQKPIVSVDDIWHSELQLDEVNTDKVSLNKHFKFHHLVVAYQPVWRHLFISFLTVSQPEEGSIVPLSFLDQCFME